MNNICIVGAGVTGLSMLLLLQESGADLSKVVIVDPHFDGGDLARKWTAVQSNTPMTKTTNAIAATCPSIPALATTTETTKLIDIIHLLRSLTEPLLKQVRQIQGTVVKGNFSTYMQQWTIQIQAAGKPIELTSRRLILTQGADPKTMDLPIPSVPLEIAIDTNRLQHYIKSGARAIVFGTMHSGTLVIRNLVRCGASVVAFYASPEPFYWDRNGAYDGIKEEAAQIADEIVAGRIPVQLVPVSDTATVIRKSHSAEWVIYAMGFQQRNVELSVDAISQSALKYDGQTGALKDIPAAWGFGIAYPNAAPDGVHWDVSVAAFLEHMKKQMPAIINGLS